MCLDEVEEHKLMFKYWSFEETWKRSVYELYFMKQHFTVFGPKSFKIEASSLEKLSQKFVEKFQIVQTSEEQ